MSRENVEIVQKIYEAAARRDSEVALNLYDPDVELDFTRLRHAQAIGHGLYHGHDGLRSWYGEWYEAWENFEEICEELIDAGDQVVSVWNQRGRGRASGAEVELARRAAAVWTIRDGKVVRLVGFDSREEALEAVGLRE
jgi:ketosteroid isomerase-like protein